ITHSEWSSNDAYSASAGSNAGKEKVDGASFKRLPFNFCAVSLQPFAHPVCTSAGTIFDLTNILPWLKKHGTNPIDGAPLKSSELIKLTFAKNDDDEYVDPVTYKVFTDNTHIVAIRHGTTANVFAWDTVERLNIKAKNWQDLVSDEEFSRADITTLQDPQNIGARDLSSFKYLKDGVSTLTPEQEAERNASVNVEALGSSAKILKAKEAVTRARASRDNANPATSTTLKPPAGTKRGIAASSASVQAAAVKSFPYNAAQHTTGKAAASFTSTGLTPQTSGERALLTDEEYMLKPKRIKQKGYARMQTNLGSLNIELLPEFAPKAVWNFVQLAKKGYYRNIAFHRNIRNFMLQGGDPTGTGRGGSSIWGGPFVDEFEGPMTHAERGIVSMANKGKNTNTSQFFVMYRPAKHLDRKHTIFGRVVGGLETLAALENVKTDERDKPVETCVLEDVVVFVDPFEEFMKMRSDKEREEAEKREIERMGGTEDEKMTWTGKRVRRDGAGVDDSRGAEVVGVGKYLKAQVKEQGPVTTTDETVGNWDQGVAEPVRKKVKGGFGNFDGW
ncbi:hypothetical protein LTR04_002194, partial [Oleoguttula sp. CCFEE 6159]